MTDEEKIVSSADVSGVALGEDPIDWAQRDKDLAELEEAVKSGVYKEPIEYLEFLLTKIGTSSNEAIRENIERQLRLYKTEAEAMGLLGEEEEDEEADKE